MSARVKRRRAQTGVKKVFVMLNVVKHLLNPNKKRLPSVNSHITLGSSLRSG